MLASFAELDALIHAGLGDTPRDKISRSDYPRAMRGEIVKRKPENCECGTCDSCRLRAKGFREAGVVDPG